VSESRTHFGAWLRRIGRARRIVLYTAPGLLVLFLLSSEYADHFGWGYFPWLVLLVILPLVLVYVLAEFVAVGAWWLLGRYSQRARAATGSVAVPAVLRFDLMVMVLYLVAWLTILIHDHWFA